MSLLIWHRHGLSNSFRLQVYDLVARFLLVLNILLMNRVCHHHLSLSKHGLVLSAMLMLVMMRLYLMKFKLARAFIIVLARVES